MEEKIALPKRKHPRLADYDYSANGAYFVTICSQNKRHIFSRIVGRGLAPAEPISPEYTIYGKIAQQQFDLLEERYPGLTVDRCVIMPNHIHAVLLLEHDAAGASPRPTLMDIICAYKSLTTRECRKHGLTGRLFQSSFYEHIVRGREDYEDICRYIEENPLRWQSDRLYTEE